MKIQQTSTLSRVCKLALSSGLMALSMHAKADGLIGSADFYACYPSCQTIATSYRVAGAPADTGIVERSWTGTTFSGETGQTTAVGQAFAVANYDSLKAFATISVTNPLISAGMPQTWSTEGRSFVQQTLFALNPAVTSVKFEIHIDGSLLTSAQSQNILQANPSGAYVTLVQGNQKIYEKGISSNGGTASFDDVVFTDPIPVNSGRAYLDISLHTSALMYTQGNPGQDTELEGGTFGAQSLFNNTATLGSAYGYDSNGQQVSLGGLFAINGLFQYAEAPVASVPEPTNALLMLLGFTGLWIKLRRNCANAQRGLDALNV